MKAVLEKLSAYHIFGYLLPGSLFVILGERLTSFSLIQRSWIVGIVLYYFIGLVISRVGTLIVKPVLERIGLVREASYDDYVEASESDSRIDILSAQNNLFRTLCAMVMMLIGLKIGEKVIGVLPWGADVYDFIVLVALFILFVFSYRKKTQELVRRVKHVQQKGQE
ncbi:hypothetical protein C6502_12920 [Candidatus Poribacteria bacterium]|nr:MAG: hypothetical protein C6502_12920 [Candidatus Poribacteria bacterium]